LLASQPGQQRQVESAYRTALGRSATTEEIARAGQYLAKAREELRASGTAPAELSQESLASYLRALLASNEFLFVD
jgi:hypothetical protein